MNITLYKITDATNKLEKTLENGIIISGTLRAQTSIINPKFKLGFDCSAYNYIYVPAFNRYYFITNITTINNNIWEIECAIDVLMTYKDNIKSLDAILSNGANPNPYNTDADYPREVRTNVKRIDFNYTFVRNNYMVMVAVGSGLI